jgi:hypothetical protein
MMQAYTCPSCGGEVAFKSSVSVTCVCPYCRSLIVRHDKDVEAMGKMAEVPDDISPFQIGTEGSYNRVQFALIGRVRMAWEDGGWNEWFLWFNDGRSGWLAEAQGFLAISFKLDDADSTLKCFVTTKKQPLSLGQYININGQAFSVADLKEAESVTCEGELPSVVKKGQKTFSADLISNDGKFASIEFDEDWRPQQIFVGSYLEFDALSFSHLRELPGWWKGLLPSPPSKVEKRP